MLYSQIKNGERWLAFSKGTIADFQQEVVIKHSESHHPGNPCSPRCTGYVRPTMASRCNCEFEVCHPHGDCSNQPWAQIEAYGINVTLCADCLITWKKFDVVGGLELTEQLRRKGITL